MGGFERRTRGRWRHRAVGAAFVGLALAAVACGGPGREALRGTWRANSGPNVLTLEGATWRLESGRRVWRGNYAVVGNRIVLVLTDVNHPAYRDYCGNELDVYSWSLRAGALAFRPESTTDPNRSEGSVCNVAVQAVFALGPWTHGG